jgi:hypothetical protein
VVQLGVFRSGRVALGGALAALVVSAMCIGSGQATALTLAKTVGPHCRVTTDSPVAGETTLTDSTIPTLTSVSWARPRMTVQQKATVPVTVTLSDDCSGAGDVVLELRNATTKRTWYVGATYASSTITSAAIHDTWNVDVPLDGTNIGIVSVVHVLALTGFTHLVYDSTKPPTTVTDVLDRQPEVEQVRGADYHTLTPATPTRIAVQAGTTSTASAAS